MKTTYWIITFAVVAAVAVPWIAWGQASVACTVTPNSYAESFTGNVYRDPNSSVQGWPTGGVQLNFKAGGFPNAALNPNLGNERVYVMNSGDFTGDGRPDLVALSDTGGTCHIDVLPNTTTNPNGVFLTRRNVATCTGTLSTGAPVMAVGDVDADGQLDIVVATVTTPLGAGTIATAQLFHNTGMSGGYPTFSSTDISAMLTAQSVAWHTSGTQLALRDVDYDGRADLVVFSSGGSTNKVLAYSALGAGLGTGFNTTPSVLIANTNLQSNIASSTQNANCGYNCAPNAGCYYTKGGTAMAVSDFNGDTYQDIIVGSVSENKLYVFIANSDGTYALNSNIQIAGPLLAYGGDIDGGGTKDLIVFQSGNDCGGAASSGVSTFYNAGAASFSLSGRTLPIGGTTQFGALLDVDGDTQNTLDVIAGKVTGIGEYSYYQNLASTSTYNLMGTAVSKKLVALDPNTQGAVSVVVTNLSSTTPAGTTLTMYVTNDGGADWELLSSTELAGAEHTFTHFGADVRWKAVLTAPSATLTGTQVYYTPGATVTPKITSLVMTINSVGQSTYTRSGLAHGKFTNGLSTTEMLYSAAFSYPGFEAKLYAYNINNLVPGATATGSVARVDTDSSVSLAWEAGALLSGRTATSRTLYTAYPASITADPDVVTDTLLSFNAAQATGGTSTPSLATMMNITPLTNAQRTALMTWLTSGMGDPNNWKLFDPGHSTPVFLGAPSGDANYIGQNYSQFMTAQSARTPVVLLGGNDGFLHAFNAATGSELWAFIPYNLLSKLKTQQYTDPNGNVSYVHQNFVDGRITVQDVYSGTQWYTVAVVGEGQGTGLAGNNYYFALDLTDPTNPKALWEFSDEWSKPAPVCSITNNTVASCYEVCTPSTVCRSECQPYDSCMLVSTTNTVNLTAGSPYGAIEAEHFDNEVTSSTSTDWATQSTIGSSRSGLYESTPNTSNCTSGSQANVAGCTMLSYHVYNDANSAISVYPYVRMYPASSTQINMSFGIDGVFTQTTALSPSGTQLNAWNWYQAGATALSLPAGDHYVNVWMYQANAHLDTLLLAKNTNIATALNLPVTTQPPETCRSICELNCTTTCTNTTYAANGSVIWPQCGAGAGMTCCGQTGGDQYCATAGTCANTPESVMGQTYSPPSIARVNTTNGPKWIAMFGSGYNNRTSAPNVGRDVYALDAYSGALMGHWNVGDIANGSNNPSTIDNTIPGGVAMADVDNDGYVDRAYFGDLEGRLWKLNMSKITSLTAQGLMPATDYPTCVVFDAGNPNQTGTRVWAPIITTPAVASLAAGTANVYFGTGGDDRAPDTVLYKFYSVRDTDTVSQCQTPNRTEGSLSITNLEWVLGDGYTNASTKVALANPNDEGSIGDRFWADPVISNGTTIYTASLPGKIESVDPCVDMQGVSKIYGYAIQAFSNSGGIPYQPGTTVLGVPWIASLGKVRTAALIRNAPLQGSVPHGASNPVTQVKSDVFLQNFSGANAGDRPAIQRLTEGGNQIASKLRLLRWREVPL